MVLLIQADGKSVHPTFGDLFLNEPLPVNGKLDLSDAGPGFGLVLNPQARLLPAKHFISPLPEFPLAEANGYKESDAPEASKA
jgi:L-rhamnonate dehydratase